MSKKKNKDCYNNFILRTRIQSKINIAIIILFKNSSIAGVSICTIVLKNI